VSVRLRRGGTFWDTQQKFVLTKGIILDIKVVDEFVSLFFVGVITLVKKMEKKIKAFLFFAHLRDGTNPSVNPTVFPWIHSSAFL